jgi:hypothetical protein
MHSVTMHEIVFSFLCVWPLSIFVTLVFLRAGERPSRAVFWFSLLGGPVASVLLLTTSFLRTWDLDADGYAIHGTTCDHDARQRRLDRGLLVGLSAVGLGWLGTLLPLPPGPREWISGLHAGLAALLGAVFLAYAYRFLRARTSPATAVLGLAVGAIPVLALAPARPVWVALSFAVVLSFRWMVRSWNVSQHTRVAVEKPPAEVGQKLLLRLVIVLSAVEFASGIAIFVHPGWTAGYFGLVKAHAALGSVLAILFVGYLLRHVRHHAGWQAAAEVTGMLALVTGAVVALNQISAWWAAGVAMIGLALWLGRRAAGRLQGRAGTVAVRAGLALTAITVLTLASGAYIAEPINSWLNNNIGLYVLYAHGTAALILLPWIVALVVHHALPDLSPARRETVRRAFLVGVPVYLVLLVAGSLHANWKWFGPDAGAHYWPPEIANRLLDDARRDRTTYVTHSAKPPIPNEGAYPSEFDTSFRDHTVCANAGCHPGLVESWQASTHRFAGSNLFFRKVMGRMQEELGTDQVNYFCINCHDPALVLHPDRARGVDLERLPASEGISCKACHLMCSGAETERPWGGRYEIRPESAYPVSPSDPEYVERSADFIRWDLRLHFRNYSIPGLSHSGELCAACHVASMPTFLTGLDEDLLATDLFTSWKNSAWAARGMTCVKCHMPERPPRDERGFLYPDHRMPGLNTGIALLVDGDEEERKSAKSLGEFTEALLKDPEAAWPDSIPFLDLAIEAPPETRPGGILSLGVRTTNSRVGHYFHAGPSSLNEVWLEVKVTDATGRVLLHSGSIEARDRAVDSSAHRLGATLRDKRGVVIRDCGIWRVASVEGSRRIEPYETIEDRYEVAIPSDARGPLSITATWNHRRASQAFVDWVYGGSGPAFPIVPVASTTATTELAGAPR